MVDIKFEKIYAVDRINEPCYVGIPFPKGEQYSLDKFAVKNEDGNIVPAEFEITSNWEDNSIKWIFARFYANIYANKGAKYFLDTNSEEVYKDKNIEIYNDEIDNGLIKIKLSKEKNKLFNYVLYNGVNWNISYPILVDSFGNKYDYISESVKIISQNKLCGIYIIKGWHILNESKVFKNEIKITVYKNKPYFEITPRLINTSDNVLDIKSYSININKTNPYNPKYMAGKSNYKTKFCFDKDAYIFADAKSLKFESNEHFAEVFYGTFFGDYCDDDMGVCATIYQAQQNFPKAIKVDETGINAMLVPENMGKVIMQSGMSREQKIELFFHSSKMDKQEINSHSIIYQMPDRALISPDVYKRAKVFDDVFVDNKDLEIETFLLGKIDEHARCYGMMNWGDTPDINYTEQGRGGGNLVWTNNEYDFPHSCALQYVRTGMRRFQDYVIVTASHWMDVDVCHYSNNSLVFGGQFEHTNGHVVNGKIVCSHQWVEGLLDYYHFTGDKRGLETAIGIGNVIRRILETDQFNCSGDTSARETGWALRSLTALYKETNDKLWLKKCDWIVGHFKDWEKKYGLWLSAYTDNTAIRVVFMISVAVGSLMRYYRICKNKEIKDMILRAVDDLCENAVLDNGLFYYKELPSLNRLGVNPLILEALTIAYELSGDVKYLKIGVSTLKYVISFKPAKLSMSKKIIEDTVIAGIEGTKSFAQLMVPVATFYKAASENNLL